MGESLQHNCDSMAVFFKLLSYHSNNRGVKLATERREVAVELHAAHQQVKSRSIEISFVGVLIVNVARVWNSNRVKGKKKKKECSPTLYPRFPSNAVISPL